MLKRALFLDRDGVVNVDRDYVHRIEDFEWRPGVFELARAAHAAAFLVVVVTNQSGIGRGFYTTEQFETLTTWMEARFAAEGAPVTRTYHCPYHPQATVDRFRADHPWRKPKTGYDAGRAGRFRARSRAVRDDRRPLERHAGRLRCRGRHVGADRAGSAGDRTRGEREARPSG